MNSDKRLAILALIIANIIWGAAFPIYKLSLTHIPPFTFLFLRFFIAAIILFPFVYRGLRIKTKDIATLIFLSTAGITLTISFLNFGLTYSSSINAPIILSASPLILIAGSVIFLKERLKKKILIGTLISFLGVLLIVLAPVLENGWNGTITGNLFFVFAGIFSVVHALLLKKILPKYNVLTISFWSFLIGALPVIPFVSNEFNQTQWIYFLNKETVLGILFAIFASTALAHTIFAYGIKYIKASEVGVFSYVDPIATILVAVPLLNEVVTPAYVIAAALVFGGIFIAEGRIHYHPLHRLLKG